MSNSNSKNMTLEEKIVQHLKSEVLYSLVDDEESILTLVKRAIDEALFKPVPVVVINNNGYGSPSYSKDSLVVERARVIANEGIDLLIEKLTNEILNDNELKKVILQEFVKLMPIAVLNRWDSIFNRMIESGSVNTQVDLTNLKYAISNKFPDLNIW
jgi:hypothetical protein